MQDGSHVLRTWDQYICVHICNVYVINMFVHVLQAVQSKAHCSTSVAADCGGGRLGLWQKGHLRWKPPPSCDCPCAGHLWAWQEICSFVRRCQSCPPACRTCIDQIMFELGKEPCGFAQCYQSYPPAHTMQFSFCKKSARLGTHSVYSPSTARLVHLAYHHIQGHHKCASCTVT